MLNGLVAWVLARNTRSVNARVAALLVSEELVLSLNPLAWVSHEREWRLLGTLGPDFARRTDWLENRSTLGHTLTTRGYVSVAAAYRLVASVSAMHDVFPIRVSDADYVEVRTAELATLRAMAYLRVLTVRPPIWKPQARRRFDRETQATIDGLTNEDMTLHGAMPPGESDEPHSD
jgi:hypothetical protein